MKVVLASLWTLMISSRCYGLTPSTGTKFSKPLVKEIGITAPFSKKFDPLSLSENIKDTEFARLRESELKHARAAMIGATVIPLAEVVNHEPGINFVSKMPLEMQLSLLGVVGVAEFASMLNGWENPFENGSSGAFRLEEDYQPGDLGFGLYQNMSEEKFIEQSNKELNNGRLAMFAALGMLAQELITNQPLI